VLASACTGDLYPPSPQDHVRPPARQYADHGCTMLMNRYGRICQDRRKIILSTEFTGQKVDIRGAENIVWPVSFYNKDRGYFDK